MSVWWVLPGATILSLFTTYLVKQYAKDYQLLDVPNSRSSHRGSIPRGGGVAVVVSFILGLYLLRFLDGISFEVVFGLSGAGLIVALVGLADDHAHVEPSLRLLIHSVAAGWGLYWLGGFPPLPVLGNVVDLGVYGSIVGVFLLVWLLNLYNFMDGIDGLAGIEVLTSCLGIALIIILYTPQGLVSSGSLVLLLAASGLGFLVWNFPKAKIFLGDVGSGFIGLTLGLIAIYMEHHIKNIIWCWLILLGVFVVDATFTLLRRIYQKKNFVLAHRSHAYQKASRHFGGHYVVSLGVGVINIVWLLPISMSVASGSLGGLAGVIVAYLPLILVVTYFRAGID